MFKRLTTLSNRTVLAILFFLFAGGSLWSLAINLTSDHANFAEWGESWLQNFSTEMSGAFVTFILLTLIVGNRQEKERFIRQLRSVVNVEALRAAEELGEQRWLYDGSLQGVNLQLANLAGANLTDGNLERVNLAGARLMGAYLIRTNLRHANLESADLISAHLEGANLWGARLQLANLENANLEGANLTDANLEQTDFEGANFKGARLNEADFQASYMENANLEGANLTDANLEGANLTGVSFSQRTILPDKSFWTPTANMLRFTDPLSPKFWRPASKSVRWLNRHYSDIPK